MLNNKVSDIKNNLSLIKENFKNNNKGKKIKPSQLLDIIDEIEKLLFYLFHQLNKYNMDTQKISPYLNLIFNMVSLISFNSPLEINNNGNNIYNITPITPITIDINTLFNTTTSNYINKFNSNKYFKDNILMQNNINETRIETKNQSFMNLFYINNKIFSSSELIKYRSIYEGLEMSQIITIFQDI